MANVKTVEDIGKIVKKTREYQGVTQEKLAFICGTGVRFIADLEKGKSTCQVGKVLNVLNSLKIHVDLRPPITLHKKDR